MKKWLTILCVAMGLLLIVGLCFIGAGLQREKTPQKQLQREMEKKDGAKKEIALFTLSEVFSAGEATHV